MATHQPMSSRIYALCLCLLTAGALTPAGASFSPGPVPVQEEQPYDFNMPDNLKSFWESYTDAKDDGDAEDMDKVVRGKRSLAEECLDLLLDDLCQKEIQSLHHEVRTLAWTLDDVTRSERYITRVRLVLDMEMRDRVRRYRARRDWWDAIDLEDLAKSSRTFEAWEAALQGYLAVYEETLELGDLEMALNCLSRCEQVERQRERPWERSRYLAEVVKLGDQLPFRDAVAAEAKQALDALIGMGIDPEKDKPEDLAKKDSEAPTGGGRGLDSFAEGAQPENFKLERKSNKKGIVGVKLPTVWPADQYQLWPKTWVSGNGPEKFDMQRSTFLAPWGQQWYLGRSGIFQFELDTNGDGKPDFEFAPSTSPSLVEVPGPEGEDPYPMMVCVLSDQEQMFGAKMNYAPNGDGSRLRFWLASWMQGKVLGDTWKVYDLNMDGKFGPIIENWGEVITSYEPDDGAAFWEPDGVLIGRAKKAVPLSSVMPIGKDYYRCSPNDAGTEFRLQKMHLSTGTVKLNLDMGVRPEFILAKEVGGKLDGAIFDILPSKKGGEVVLPAGEYRLALGSLRTGKKTSTDLVRMYTGTSETFKVHAGVLTEVDLGAPYKITFKTRTEGKEKEIDTRTLRVFGRGGEEYAMFFDDPLQPDVSVQDSDGRSVVKEETMRRAGLEHWQNNNQDGGVDNVLWFPVKYSIEMPKGASYQFKLSQKKHALLGGPLESDWIQ